MSITKDQILESISNMSVTDIVELISLMEKKFGISAKNYFSNNEEKVEKPKKEKTEFNILLKSVGMKKIAVIKLVNSLTGLGLKGAKNLVESAPVVVKEKISKEESVSIEASFKEAGAEIEI